MELPSLGKQCDVPSCQQLDFLPIVCNGCGGVYCKEHSYPDYHVCLKEGMKKGDGEDGEKASVCRHKCEMVGCEGGELTPVVCEKCNNNYCLKHRHQSDHKCPALIPADRSKQEEAAEHIKTITSKMKEEKGRKQGRRNDKLAAKVQLMKLKQKSTGEKTVPQEDRVYLLVFLPKSSSSSSSIPVFISRHWTIGRAIDSIASVAKVPNNNNILGAPKLRLYQASSGLTVASTDTKISDLIDTTLFNGQNVIMEYVKEEEEEYLCNYESYK